MKVETVIEDSSAIMLESWGKENTLKIPSSLIINLTTLKTERKQGQTNKQTKSLFCTTNVQVFSNLSETFL